MWGKKISVALSSMAALGAILTLTAIASEKQVPAAAPGEIACFDDGGLKAFDRVAELIERRNRLVHGQLHPLGAETRQLLVAISEDAHRANDRLSADHALRARENFLLARLYAARFLDGNDLDDAARVDLAFAELYLGLEALAASLEDPERRELLAAAAANLPRYKQAFDQAVEIGRRAMDVRAAASTGQAALETDVAFQAMNSI
jgi:hypothetical protein